MTRLDRIRACLASAVPSGPIPVYQYDKQGRATGYRHCFAPLTIADDDAIDTIHGAVLPPFHSYEEALILFLLIGKDAP